MSALAGHNGARVAGGTAAKARPGVIGDRAAAAATALVFLCLSLMVWASVHFGSFYDDEIANISILDKSFHDLVAFANSLDVHPPGQYVINKALLMLLGNLGLVKIVSGSFSAAALAAFLWMSRRSLPATTFLVLAFLLATMSTVVLWDASLRWYSYFNAVFFLVTGMVLFSHRPYATQLSILAGAAVLLFHIGYLVICALPPLSVVFFWRNRRRLTVGNLLLTAVVGVIATAICLPQAWYFVHVHMTSKGTQVASPIAAFAQTAMTVVVGNSVFPLSVPAAIYGATVAVCLIALVALRRARELDYLAVVMLGLAVIIMVGSGVGLKPRNSVFLLPFTALLVASALTHLPRALAAGTMAIVAAFQILGVWDVVAHTDTVKGSYNTPYQTIMAALDRDTRTCSKVIVFHHDGVISYLLQQSRFQQSTPWIKGPADIVVTQGDCIAVIKTYRGVFSAGDLANFYAVTQDTSLKPIASQDIDEDAYAARKSMLGKETFPRFYAHIEVLRAEKDMKLADWATIKYRSFFLDPNA